MPTMTAPISAPPKPRTSLNKRVAFPMQSSAPASGAVQTTAEGLPLPFSTTKYQPPPFDSVAQPQTISSVPVVLPPPPSTALNPTAPLPSVFNPVETSNQSVDEAFDADKAMQFCQSIFSGLAATMATNTEQSKLSEIRKRLETLEQMWAENKINESAQKNLYQLAKGSIQYSFNI